MKRKATIFLATVVALMGVRCGEEADKWPSGGLGENCNSDGTCATDSEFELYCSENEICKECKPGLVSCSNECVDLEVDPDNCGACGDSCGSGYGCDDALCVAAAMGKLCNTLETQDGGFDICLELGNVVLSAYSGTCSDCIPLPIGNDIDLELNDCAGDWFVRGEADEFAPGEDWLFITVVDDGVPTVNAGTLKDEFDCEDLTYDELFE